MDFLYISPEFPPNYAHFIRHFYAMPADLQAALSWYVRTDLNNPDWVQRAVDALLKRKHALGHPGNFDLVESHNEQWLTLEGLINETYGIDGIKQVF